YTGQCHCKTYTYSFSLPTPIPADAKIVSCNCSYCTIAGPLYLRLPPNNLAITSNNFESLSRYQYASKNSIFYFCPTCHSLLMAIRMDPEEERGTTFVNLRTTIGFD
ncbi:hypothetical protein BT69DRAFT_1182306, partial [Atractiella rhizophila]